MQLVSDMQRHQKAAGSAADDGRWLESAQRLLGQFVGTGHVDWTEIGRQNKTSPDYFRKKFTALAGISPARYLAQRNMEWACHELEDTKATLKRTAERLGFADPFQFSRRFKQIVGVSPSVYRDQILHKFRPRAS